MRPLSVAVYATLGLLAVDQASGPAVLFISAAY